MKGFSVKHSFLSGLGLILISVLLSVVFIEIFVRVFVPQDLRPTYQRPDRQVKYKLAQNSDFFHKSATGEYDVNVKTNSLGFRMGELSDEAKIMVLGDSLTFGFGVEQGSIYPALLQNGLHTAGYRAQVVNMGTEGRTPAQYWADFHFYKERINPIAIVIGFFEGNDFIESSPIVNYVDDRPVLVPFVSSGAYALLRNIMQGPLYDVLAQNSHTAILIKNSLYILLRRQVDPVSVPPKQDKHIVKPYPKPLKFVLDVLTELLRESDPLPVVFFVIPNPDGEHPYTQTLVDEMRGTRVMVLEVRSMLEANDLQNLYFKKDRHLNANGHKILGDRLRDFIIESHMIDCWRAAGSDGGDRGS